MGSIQIVPKTGQQSSIGTGPVYFMSPNAPVVANGDSWTLLATGQQPSRLEVGYAMPWDTELTYVGSTDANGNLILQGTCTAAGLHNITDGNGIVLAAGVLPTVPGGPIPQPGEPSIFGYYPCQFTLLAAPAPPTNPGVLNTAQAVVASWTSGVPVVSYKDLVPVQYVVQLPYGGTMLAQVYIFDCLSDSASAKLATLLGGTVSKAAPPPPYPSLGILTSQGVVGSFPIVSATPVVNYITASIPVNGVPTAMIANAGLLMMAISCAQTTAQDPKNLAVLQAAIVSAFQPV